MRNLSIVTFLLVFFVTTPASAEHLGDFISYFAAQAKTENPGFSGFSATRGEQFFKNPHTAEWSCSSCHTDNPAHTGKHVVTQQTINPLAPSANAERFTNPAKVERWFKRNCKDVVGRECTCFEKGDVLSYLQDVGQ